MPISFPSAPTLNQTYTFSGRTWIWTGTVWQSVGTAQGLTGTQGIQGTIGVQGLTGIQGASTAPVTSYFTAKGQILVATGSGTVAAQDLGSNGQTLLADSSQSDGIRWGDDKDIMSVMGAY